jgi:hypothetical protein
VERNIAGFPIYKAEEPAIGRGIAGVVGSFRPDAAHLHFGGTGCKREGQEKNQQGLSGGSVEDPRMWCGRRAPQPNRIAHPPENIRFRAGFPA